MTFNPDNQSVKTGRQSLFIDGSGYGDGVNWDNAQNLINCKIKPQDPVHGYGRGHVAAGTPMGIDICSGDGSCKKAYCLPQNYYGEYCL